MFTLIALMICAIASYAQEEEQKTVNITANFTYCWNSAAESVASSEDGSLTYSSAAWGGLAAWVQGTDYGDLSIYSKIVFEFAEATTVNTQILVQLADESNVSAWGNVGITELACEFGENDMSAVNQIALQTSEAVTLNVKRVYLVVRSGDEPGPVDPVDPTVDQTKDLMPDFKGVWNEAETVTDKEDGTKEYVAAEWGGMNAWYGTADWSEWDALVVEFAEATPCATKLAILPGELAANAEAGVTSIKLEFGDADVSAIEQAALQTAEACTLNITKIYLIKYGTSALKGDVNEDKKVDISDIVAVINQIAGTAEYVGSDVNEDKKVDISDIVAIINIIAGAE